MTSRATPNKRLGSNDIRFSQTTYDSRIYGPTNFHNIELFDCEAAFGSGPDKLVLKGRFSLNDVYVSKNMRRELQLQVYAPKGSVRLHARNSDVWDRCEIFLAHDQLDSLVEALLKIKTREVI